MINKYVYMNVVVIIEVEYNLIRSYMHVFLKGEDQFNKELLHGEDLKKYQLLVAKSSLNTCITLTNITGI